MAHCFENMVNVIFQILVYIFENLSTDFITLHLELQVGNTNEKFFHKNVTAVSAQEQDQSKVGTDHDDVRRALAVVVTVSCNSHAECFHGKIVHFRDV